MTAGLVRWCRAVSPTAVPGVVGIMPGGFALLSLKRLLGRVVVALTDRCPGTFCGYFVWNFVVR